jgi:hypothetical protein
VIEGTLSFYLTNSKTSFLQKDPKGRGDRVVEGVLEVRGGFLRWFLLCRGCLDGSWISDLGDLVVVLVGVLVLRVVLVGSLISDWGGQTVGACHGGVS